MIVLVRDGNYLYIDNNDGTTLRMALKMCEEAVRQLDDVVPINRNEAIAEAERIVGGG